MIPRRQLNRFPVPIPELTGYVVDAEGQVWRREGARNGADRPLRAMGFVDAIRSWDHRGTREETSIVHLMPGAWRWCLGHREDGLEWNTHGHRDSTGFFMRYAFGSSIGRPRPWAAWNEAEREAQAACAATAPRPAWYVIRAPSLGRDAILLAGPIIYASIASNGTSTTD